MDLQTKQGFYAHGGTYCADWKTVAVDFRQGNVPPNKNNLAFIKQYQQSLPTDVKLDTLHIDSADYQTSIIHSTIAMNRASITRFATKAAH